MVGVVSTSQRDTVDRFKVTEVSSGPGPKPDSTTGDSIMTLKDKSPLLFFCKGSVHGFSVLLTVMTVGPNRRISSDRENQYLQNFGVV